jgi:hypothetical protein
MFRNRDSQLSIRITKHLLLLVLVGVLLFGACYSGGTKDTETPGDFNSIAQPYIYNLWQWEVAALRDKLVTSVARNRIASSCEDLSVIRYFEIVREKQQLNNSLGSTRDSDMRFQTLQQEELKLRDCVEYSIETRIKEVLQNNGISSPLFPGATRAVFPPVLFQLEPTPKLLVISKRDKIELINRITLRQDMTDNDRSLIENKCDKYGVSSLVEDTGGIATYPSLVANDGNLRFTLSAVAEEWVHQYLTFKPLGWAYVLDIWGVKPDREIATINETLAGMVSRELSNQVYRDRYAKYETPTRPTPVMFDFNLEMRTTRLRVDQFLREGRIIEAEQYMEERRKLFVDKGYQIRKLNQAYFAFHGTYGYSPSSVSPVYADLQRVRSRSSTLGEFLNSVASVQSYAELYALAGR